MHYFFNAASFILAALVASQSHAASCCGGGFASPSVITGDEKATLSSELSYSNIATEVSNGGIWQTRSSEETFQTFRIQGAHIFLDRFQAGGSLPLIRRSRAENDSSGVGDAIFNLGFETLPEWEYSAWRPRAVSYLTLFLPTGRSIQDSTDSLGLDARGRGFWSLGLGTTVTKIVSKFDFVLAFECHKSFAREVQNASFTGELVPGIGGSVQVGAGFNFQDTRVGLGFQTVYEDPVATRGAITTDGSPSRFTTASLSASQMLGNDWAAALTVSDQTLFGAPTNTSLAKSVSVSLQRRFLR